MSIQPIRLGIIGTGLAVEQLHWPAITELADRFQITAFCDIDTAHAEHFSEYSGVSMDEFTGDYHELLARTDVDAVLISLPIPLQGQVLRDSLAAGKHVLSEKPPAANQEELDSLVSVVEAHPDQVLLVGENYFYQDPIRFARKLLDDGVIGRVHTMSFRRVKQLLPIEGTFSSTPWRWQGAYTGGPHLDGGVHQIAMIRMLMGDVRHLAAETQDANSTHGGPSSFTVNMRFVSEAIGNLTLGNHEYPMPEDDLDDMRIYSSDGVMSINDDRIVVWKRDETTTYTFSGNDGGYVGEFQNFHEAVTMSAPVIGTFAQSYRGMEIVTRGLQSSDEARGIEITNDLMPLFERPLEIWLPHGETELEVNVTEKKSAGLKDRA